MSGGQPGAGLSASVRLTETAASVHAPLTFDIVDSWSAAAFVMSPILTVAIMRRFR
jgi:hypothetical protein